MRYSQRRDDCRRILLVSPGTLPYRELERDCARCGTQVKIPMRLGTGPAGSRRLVTAIDKLH